MRCAGASLSIAIALAMIVGAGAQTPGGALHVCHAGSLQTAFARLEDVFKQQHPAITIVDTSGGSVDLARRLAAGHLECDVYAPADHLIIDRLLKPAKIADYSIVFARGRMVLGYLATDAKASELPVSGAFAPPATVPRVAAGWSETLTAPGVRIAGAHPFLDPGGYRAHMIFELAQHHLGIPGLYNRLLQHYRVNVTDASLPPLVLGTDFDFQFTYEHTAAAAATRDAAYRYAALPSEIDLSTGGTPYPASVTIPGLGIAGTPASVTIRATTVEWGVTIAAHSRNAANAIAFVAMLLGPTGRSALMSLGPTAITPARVSRNDARRLPAPLRPLTRR